MFLGEPSQAARLLGDGAVCSYRPIVDYIDAQFESYLQEELKIRRSLFDYHDTRVHVCLYFITPTGHSLKSLDLVTMKKLDSKVCPSAGSVGSTVLCWGGVCWLQCDCPLRSPGAPLGGGLQKTPLAWSSLYSLRPSCSSGLHCSGLFLQSSVPWVWP